MISFSAIDSSGNTISAIITQWSQQQNIGNLDSPIDLSNFINNLPSETEKVTFELSPMAVDTHAGTNTFSADLQQFGTSLGIVSYTWTKSHDCNASIFDPDPQC